MGVVIPLAGGARGSQRAVEEWVAEGTGRTMAIDALGNVYVTYGFVTRKYGPDSNEPLWVATESGWSEAIAVDGSNNVYVTGDTSDYTPSQDYCTIKYGPDSNEPVWIGKYDGPGNPNDRARAIAVDDSGNVYVTGVTGQVGGEGGKCATVKYDTDGNQVWVGIYPAEDPTIWGDGRAVALDDSGNIYVASRGYITIKYEPDSNDAVWTATYTGNTTDYGRAIALDNSGNIYVTGHTIGNGTDSDYATIKYGPDSNEPVWIARYNGPANGTDEARAVVLDSSGNVYVTGRSTGNGTGDDYATIKYDPDGNEVWVARYDGPVNGRDRASMIVLDDSDNIYVTGQSEGIGTRRDYATIKYSPDSNEPLWVARYNGLANDYDDAYAIGVDDWGNVYVTGRSWGGYDTIKYAQCSEVGDIDCDKDVNFRDFAVMGDYWMNSGCGDCGWADLDDDEDVDFNDLKMLAENWLAGKMCLQAGDIDCDSDVDFEDFVMLAARWQQTSCGECDGADLTGDGTVDFKDLKKLADNWLKGK